MSWRFFWVLSALMVAFVANGWLLFTEDIQSVVDVEVDNQKIRDELAENDMVASTRLQNFRAFGLPDNLAEAASSRAGLIMSQRGPDLKLMLNQDIDVVARIFCAGGMPQRYAALEVLVVEENLDRRVLDGMDIIGFEPQPWFSTSYTPQVYEHMELVEKRRSDSTALGLAAILSSEEKALLDDESPWRSSIGSSLAKVAKEQPGVESKLVRYLALMHVLTELANSTSDGICAVNE